MTRLLLNLVTALSLLLCLPALVFWGRSYFKQDAVQVVKSQMRGVVYDEESWQAWSGRGGLSVNWGHHGGTEQTQQAADDLRRRTRCDGLWHAHLVQWNWGPMYGDGSFSRAGRRTYAGFGYVSHDYVHPSPTGFQKFWMLVVPWPAVVAPLAALPAVRGLRAWRRVRRDRRRRAGLCLACGYDLRGSPERCPECGRVAETKREAE